MVISMIWRWKASSDDVEKRNHNDDTGDDDDVMDDLFHLASLNAALLQHHQLLSNWLQRHWWSLIWSFWSLLIIIMIIFWSWSWKTWVTASTKVLAWIRWQTMQVLWKRWGWKSSQSSWEAMETVKVGPTRPNDNDDEIWGQPVNFGLRPGSRICGNKVASLLSGALGTPANEDDHHNGDHNDALQCTGDTSRHHHHYADDHEGDNGDDLQWQKLLRITMSK